MTEPNEETSPPPTGNATIDEALLGLADLASAPLSDHHDRLAKAHEALRHWATEQYPFARPHYSNARMP